MKTKQQILQDAVNDFLASQNDVSFLGKEASARAFLNAVSHVSFEMWNDIYQTKRAIQSSTAVGNDLVEIGARIGLTKLGASNSSCVLIFNGPVNTVIPAGTIIRSTLNSNIRYQTLSNLTLGEANGNIQRPINAESIGDIVIAESIDAGTQTAVNVNELQTIDPSITGVTVTNLTASKGGADAETDDQFRQRIIQQINLLAQGTQAFYEAACINAEPSVIKAKATPNTASGVDIYLVKNSLADYSQLTLDIIASAVYDLQRAFQTIKCYNATRKSLEIKGVFFLKLGYTPDTVFANVASQIANYTASKFDFGVTINYTDLINEILKAEGLAGMDVGKFYLNNDQVDVVCANTEVPVFTYLKFSDLSNTNTEQTINQSYLVA